MLSALDIIYKYYPADDTWRRLLILHSRQVADMALEVAHRHPELHLDEAFIERAAMLHDLGIFQTNAPGIHCHGASPYLLHGRLGAELLRREDDAEAEAFARVCERHTGTGLTAEQIRRCGLPLPPRDFRPETVEEEIICYADKFYSKSHPDEERSPEQVCRSLGKFGEEGVDIFRAWHHRFG